MLQEIKTKKDKLIFVKNIIYKIGCSYIKQDHPYFSLFKEIVSIKQYDNISYFSIVPNRINTNTYECQVHLENGTIKVFSWIKCIRNCGETDHHKLRNIMRSAIVSDILNFKQNAIGCSYCSNIEYLQADHIEPFRDIADKYILIYGKIVNEDWIINWTKFHKQNASLQILCASCNYKKH